MGNNRINVKILKAQLTIADHKAVVKALGIPIFSESNNQIIYFSGEKNVNPLSGSPKLYYYPDTGIYVGYSSGYTMDIIGLVQKRLSLLKQPSSFMDSINFILDVVHLKIDNVTRKSNNTICDWQSGIEKFVRLKRGESVLKKYDDSIIDQLDDIYYQGWLDEGISIETLQKYQIKWYDRTSQIVIPCRDRNGDLIGIRCRNLEPEREINAKYLPLTLFNGDDYRFNTNDVFYGINHNWEAIERTGSVILVEAEKSVLKADTFLGRDSNVLALFGSQLGISRRNQLIKMGVNKVILALDSDFHIVGDEDYANFEKKIFGLGKMFKGLADVEVIYNNIGLENFYKCSPFDFDIEVYNKLWDNREVI